MWFLRNILRSGADNTTSVYRRQSNSTSNSTSMTIHVHDQWVTFTDEFERSLFNSYCLIRLFISSKYNDFGFNGFQ